MTSPRMRGPRPRCAWGAAVLAVALAAACAPARAREPAGAARAGDWPVYGGDPGATKFSPLAQIDRGNVARLAVAWEWATGEAPLPAHGTRPGTFQATPIVIRDTMYLSTPYNRVVALDARSGRQLWAFDPRAYEAGQVPNGTGFVHRGVAAWSDGRSRRIFINSRWRLIALDAATGRPAAGFGDAGEVDLVAGLGREIRRTHYTNTSPPAVYGDLVIVGNGVADKLSYRGDPPGVVQAFDARTGRRVWAFDPVPGPGEPGNETWEDGSWREMGHTNVWAPITVDTARGLVYLPVSTPRNDWYGGARKGDNLYAESVVCLDARTGRRVWHFQTVHHGVWDYDLPAPPTLLTLREPDGARDLVAVPTKMGYLYVFDRVTGEPRWPIVERPVPASDVPGERLAPTQPAPTLPLPFAKQGFGQEDVIDFTPELRAQALAALENVRVGPLWTPPSREGTVAMPGNIGGSGWGGAAYDPATGTIYVKATNSPTLYRLIQPARSDSVDADYALDFRATIGVRPATRGDTADLHAPPAQLPIGKPPYGTLTAIDLHTGQHRWQVPLGDTPSLRSHPALQGVALPPLLGVAGAPGPIVTAGGLLFVTGGGDRLYAIDATSGRTLWSAPLGQTGYAVPMTYTSGGRQFVAISTGAGAGAKLVVFALPVPDER